MIYEDRKYQIEGSKACIDFFLGKKIFHALAVFPTGSGKSLIISMIANGLLKHNPLAKILILQPSKEILVQNFQKYVGYGNRAGVYSASLLSKQIHQVTFATIGSICEKAHLFAEFKYIIVDESHKVNSNDGLYKEFFKAIEKCKILGLTATPYRLASGVGGSELRFLTRTSPRIFKKIIWYTQKKELFEAGHLAPLKYYAFDVVNRERFQTNSTGSDFTAASMSAYYRQINMPKQIATYAQRLLAKRPNLLVFTALIEEAEKASAMIPGSVVLTDKLNTKQCDDIIEAFRRGRIRCLLNVKKLDTGFDYPQLTTVLLAYSTMSLARYEQTIGRVIRPYTYPDGTKKEGWIVDIGNNFPLFGKVEDMDIKEVKPGKHAIVNTYMNRQLSNMTFQRS